MQGCALVFARIPSLVLRSKTLGKDLDCFFSENHAFQKVPRKFEQRSA